ncbi:MAG: hypothetical protein ABIH99_03140 [Candidatus Micrarchaeota archaeon]
MGNKTLFYIFFLGSVLLLTPLSFASVPSDSVFMNSLFEKPKVEAREETVITGGNAYMCLRGFAQFCVSETRIVEEIKVDRKILNPFEGNELKKEANGCELDSDDEYTIANYDVSELKACSENQTSVTGVYSCVQNFNAHSNTTCMSSTSAFKIAWCSSKISKQENDFELQKAFVRGPNFNGHRFLLLKNKNGYYAIDPYWCGNADAGKCIKTHTLKFYNDSSSLNYRALVYKLEAIS